MGLTPAKNNLVVMFVKNHFLRKEIWKITKLFILARNHFNAKCVAFHLQQKLTLYVIEKVTSSKKNLTWIQCQCLLKLSVKISLITNQKLLLSFITFLFL